MGGERARMGRGEGLHEAAQPYGTSRLSLDIRPGPLVALGAGSRSLTPSAKKSPTASRKNRANLDNGATAQRLNTHPCAAVGPTPRLNHATPMTDIPYTNAKQCPIALGQRRMRFNRSTHQAHDSLIARKRLIVTAQGTKS